MIVVSVDTHTIDMGEFAQTVQKHLRKKIAESRPSSNWETEYSINGTPVDIAGVDAEHLYLIELEWRRADPANNAAKLFRHLDAGEIDAEQIALFHVFTEYYELNRGGVSSKRKNAEFVGKMAAEMIETLEYIPIEFELDPPKRGQEWPEDWKRAADDVARSLCQGM